MDASDLRERVPEPVVSAAEQGWEWLVVAGLAVFMLVTRLRTFDEFNQGSDVWFFGTDAYYHSRHVLYTVANFPRTLGFDALTQYPLGTNPGQFGTLFDQIAATGAWVLGLLRDGGRPSMDTMLDVLTAYPAVLGALSVVPIYLVVRDLFDRRGALFAAVAAALLPGSFLIRTIAGFTDHHSIEILLSTTAVWASYRAFKAWEDQDLELARIARDPERIWTKHRGALAVSLGAALAFWAYLAAWPPGVLFVGVVGLWLLSQGALEVAQGEDPVDLVVTGATTFGFLAVMMVPYALGSPQGGFSALNFTWMQPTAPLLAALALVGLAALAVVWRDRNLPEPAYPFALAGAGLLGLGVLWLILPQLVEQTLSGTSWVTGIGVDPTRRTIAEAQPADFASLGPQFGWLYISAAGGFVLAVVSLFADTDRRTHTLLIVWAALMTMGTFTQSRFLYYMAVAVLVLNGFLASRLFDAATVFAQESADEEDADVGWTGGHVAVVVVLGLILLPTNVTGFYADCGERTNAWTQADCFGGPGESKLWATELDWMEANTPDPPLTLESTFEDPGEGRYDYPEGMYGVLSWWDYGHQIEFDGRRAPVANPFQQQAPLASEIFTSDSESQALELLDDYLGEDNDARYLMIDDQMVALSSKFGAITVWADVRDVPQQGEELPFNLHGENRTIQLPDPGETMRNWFLQDVYYNDGSGMNHYRLVREYPQFSLIGNRLNTQGEQRQITGYDRILARGSWADFETGFGLGEPFDQNTAYRLQNRMIYSAEAESRLKTYERVPGATLTGQAAPAANVTAEVTLRSDNSGRTFTYEVTERAGPDGAFSVTVPYSTTDTVPPEEGGTDLDVTATGPYTVTAGDETARVDVPDPAVLEGTEVSVSFP